MAEDPNPTRHAGRPVPFQAGADRPAGSPSNVRRVEDPNPTALRRPAAFGAAPGVRLVHSPGATAPPGVLLSAPADPGRGGHYPVNFDVRREGVEPSRPKTHAPEACAAT